MARVMKMVDMARSPDEVKKDMAHYAAPALSDEPQYPWGLCISLCDEELKKLQLDTDCEVGDTVLLRATAEVKDVGESKQADGSVRHRLELQITNLAVIDPEEMAESPAEERDEERKSSRYKSAVD